MGPKLHVGSMARLAATASFVESGLTECLYSKGNSRFPGTRTNPLTSASYWTGAYAETYGTR